MEPLYTNLLILLLWLGFLAGLTFGIWALFKVYRGTKVSDEKYQTALEWPARVLFGNSYSIGSVPKGVRRARTAIQYIIISAWTIGCTIALVLLTSLILK
jgi:hypothetical protein